MNQIHLLDNLISFLNDPNPSSQAVFLTGEWGCGKTHFVKDELLAGHAWSQSTSSRSVTPEVIWISLAGISTPQALVSAVLLGRLFTAKNEEEAEELREILKLKVESLNCLSLAPAIYVFDDLDRCPLGAAAVFGLLSPLIESGDNKVLFIGDENKLAAASAGIGWPYIKEKTISETFPFQPDLAAVFEQIITSLKTSSPQEQLFVLYRDTLASSAQNFADIMNEARHRSIRTFKFFLTKMQRIIETYLSIHPDENLLSCLGKISEDLLRLSILQREGRSPEHYKIHDFFCLQSYLKDGDMEGCLHRIEAERRIPNDDPFIILKNSSHSLDEARILEYAAAMKAKLVNGPKAKTETEAYPISAYLKINELYSNLDYLGMSPALEKEKVSLNALLPTIESNIQDKYFKGCLEDLEEAYVDSSVYRGRDNASYQFSQSHSFIREKIADAIQKIYRQQLSSLLAKETWGEPLQDLYNSMAFKNYFFALLRPDEWTACILSAGIPDLKVLTSIIHQQAAAMQAGSYGGEFHTLKDIRGRLSQAKINDRMTANAVNDIMEAISSIPGAY